MAYRHFKGKVIPERDDPARDDPAMDDPERDDPEKDDPERDDQFSTRFDDQFSRSFDAKEYIRPHRMAIPQEKSKKKHYNYSNISGINPHLRSRKVEEFSQKIHDETHIRPHKMAALKDKLGSTGSPDRHMSPESTHYEAQLMLISPKNMAKLKNLPKYVPECTKYELEMVVHGHGTAPEAVDAKVAARFMGIPLSIDRQKEELKYKLLNPKKVKKPSQINIYLNKSRARRIYTRESIIRKRTIKKLDNWTYNCYTYNNYYTYKHMNQYPYKNSQKIGQFGEKYYNTAIGHLVMTAKTTAQNI